MGKSKQPFTLFFLFCILAGFVAPGFAAEIDGIWKHADKDAWLKIDAKTGIASVYEHQGHPENAGLTIVRDIVAVAGETNLWQAKMYSASDQDFVDVTIHTTRPGALEVIYQDELVLTLIQK